MCCIGKKRATNWKDVTKFCFIGFSFSFEFSGDYNFVEVVNFLSIKFEYKVKKRLKHRQILLKTSFDTLFSWEWEKLALCEALTGGAFDRVKCQKSWELY